MRKLLTEEKEKIQEIGEMLATEEIRRKRKEIFLEILNRRTYKIPPLLEKMKTIEKEFKELMKKLLTEEKEKIQEIGEMLATEEIRRKRKEIFLEILNRRTYKIPPLLDKI